MLSWKRPRIGPTAIALDPGYTGMRAVQLRPSGRQWAIAQLSRYDDGKPVGEDDRTETWQRRMHFCYERGHFSGRFVKLAFGTPEVSYHALEVPEGIVTRNNDETGIVIREEIRRMLPPVGEDEEQRDLLTAHWAVPEANIKAPNVVGVVTRRKVLDDALLAAKHAHLECLAIDCSATALSRLGNLLRPENDRQVWGLLDIGYRESRLVVCKDDIPVLTRAVGDGGQTWTKLIADDLSITEQSAEIQKKEHGINVPRRKDDPSPVEGNGTEVGTMLFGILRASLTSLAGEINRSYEYALSCYGHCDAADLILVGAGAQLKQLPQFLSEALGIPVHRASDYLDRSDCRLDIDNQDPSVLGRFANAIGLAVSE